MLSVGYDIGSSSVKAAVIDIESGATLASDFFPREEMTISSPHPGWAEQDPQYWWECVQKVTRALLSTGRVDPSRVVSIGISYQMHGLVIVDTDGNPLRPSIIWCDSRAVEIGERAFRSLGEEYCLSNMLNSPGNFTASKLRWVKENEPERYSRIAHILLPGDFIALRMTGEATTTMTGLSEGIFWNFRDQTVDPRLLKEFEIDAGLFPRIVPALGIQGHLTRASARALGLPEGIPVAYRAGDQPNNAFSLHVLHPGEVAATAGTSGVVYGVSERTTFDARSRVNLFAHVNHTAARPRLGILLCINGTGILFSWLRRTLGTALTYHELNDRAAQIAVGSDGVTVLPFGNGSERMLENRTVGASIKGLDLVRHSGSHIVRAAQEGIAFAFEWGMGIMRSMGMPAEVIRAGHANLFLSPVFRQTLATISGAHIELFDTDGAAGAARGAAVGAGKYTSVQDAFGSLRKITTVEPLAREKEQTEEGYRRWVRALESEMI